MCVCVHIYLYAYMCMCTYIYTHVYRQCMCTCHIYIGERRRNAMPLMPVPHSIPPPPYSMPTPHDDHRMKRPEPWRGHHEADNRSRGDIFACRHRPPLSSSLSLSSPESTSLLSVAIVTAATTVFATNVCHWRCLRCCCLCRHYQYHP